MNIATTYSNLPVKAIADNAFTDHNTITTVLIPDSINSIGKAAFQSCYNLKNITIPDGVITIGNLAFNACTNLTEVIIGNNVTTIGIGAFAFSQNIKTVILGNNVTTIDSEAFQGCKNLNNIIIPNSVTSIGQYVFDGCAKLEFNTYNFCNYLGNNDNPYLILIKPIYSNHYTYEINEKTKIIAGSSFNGSKLHEIIIPDSVTYIGSSAFSACTNLTTVTIGANVRSINNWAFDDCNNLTSVIFKNSIGWIAHSSYKIPSEKLNNPATAAQYLKSTYSHYTWQRTE